MIKKKIIYLICILSLICVLISPFIILAHQNSTHKMDDLDIHSYEYNVGGADSITMSKVKFFEFRNRGSDTIWLSFFNEPKAKYEIKDIYQDFFGPLKPGGRQFSLYQMAQDVNCNIVGYCKICHKLLSPGETFKYTWVITYHGPINDATQMEFMLNSTNEDINNYYCAYRAEEVYAYRKVGQLLRNLDRNNPIAFFPYKEFVVVKIIGSK